jgi:drug/metabolite transporter (DMT)-like permease
MNLSILRISAILLTFFALLTLFMSGSVIFDLFGIREKEGNYVLFIVVTNFVCGFLYLIAVYGLFTGKRWTTRLLFNIVIILLFAFFGLLGHINNGGIYETQTVKAMIFRFSVTLLFALVSWRYISRVNNKQSI